MLESAGADAWMPALGLSKLMLKELGYEDMDQFEDAMGGTFEQFIKALPHLETKIQDDGSSCDGQLVLKMKPPPLVRQGFTMTIDIKTSEVASPPYPTPAPSRQHDSFLQTLHTFRTCGKRCTKLPIV